jgi:hypothetical protein
MNTCRLKQFSNQCKLESNKHKSLVVVRHSLGGVLVLCVHDRMKFHPATDVMSFGTTVVAELVPNIQKRTRSRSFPETGDCSGQNWKNLNCLARACFTKELKTKTKFYPAQYSLIWDELKKVLIVLKKNLDSLSLAISNRIINFAKFYNQFKMLS